jgi:hypothetical protein
VERLVGPEKILTQEGGRQSVPSSARFSIENPVEEKSACRKGALETTLAFALNTPKQV